MIGRLLALGGVAAGAVAAAGAAILGRRTARRTARAQRKAERLAKRARLEAGHPERAPSSPGAAGLTPEGRSAAPAASPASAGSAAAPPAVRPPAVEPPAPHAPAGSESSVSEAGFRSIRGIGPALEERLREAGVTSIAQVAAWSEADIEAVAPLLKVTPERIRSQAWVEQAQSVLAGRPPD